MKALDDILGSALLVAMFVGGLLWLSQGWHSTEVHRAAQRMRQHSALYVPQPLIIDGE